MDGHHPSAVREEYLLLVLDTIRRYVQDGQTLSIDTTMGDGAVHVVFTFDPKSFGDYFAHRGAREMASDTTAPPAD